MRAFLLAAGLGTRLGRVTRSRPKCLLPVGGKPLLGRWFDLLAGAGVDTALVNTHWLAEQVRDYVATCDPPLEVHLAHERALLGSAGTLAANREFVRGEPGFFVAYADNASTVDLSALSRGLRPGCVAALGLFRAEDPRGCGVVELDSEGRVTSFVEKPEEPRSDLAWAGLVYGTSELLEWIPDRVPCDLGHDVLPALVGRSVGVEVQGYHRDVGTPESYERVCRDFASMESVP